MVASSNIDAGLHGKLSLAQCKVAGDVGKSDTHSDVIVILLILPKLSCL